MAPRQHSSDIETRKMRPPNFLAALTFFPVTFRHSCEMSQEFYCSSQQIGSGRIVASDIRPYIFYLRVIFCPVTFHHLHTKFRDSTSTPWLGVDISFVSMWQLVRRGPGPSIATSTARAIHGDHEMILGKPLLGGRCSLDSAGRCSLWFWLFFPPHSIYCKRVFYCEAQKVLSTFCPCFGSL